MNNKLIKRLSEKWSQPDGLPGKGYEVVREENGLSPCAQSEAVMLSKGMGVMDFEAFLKGSLSSYENQGLNLDKFTAKTLGISTVHSVLLRRFNDLSSLNPAIALTQPERVLGKNWDRVLEFWHFIDSISQGKLNELKEEMSDKVGSKEYESRKIELKASAESLDVITPDLYYLLGGAKPLDPSGFVKKTEEEVVKEIPSFKIFNSSNQHQPRVIPGLEWAKQYPNDTPFEGNATVVGDYSRAYFGWIAPYDYFRSNFPGGPELMKLQVLFACATNEIQTLTKNQGYEDLYFCKIIGYDPLRSSVLRKAKRKAKEYNELFSGVMGRLYRIVDNTIFSRLSKDENVRQAPTKEMVEGVVELTEDEILSGEAFDKIVKTYNVGKGRFFGSLRIRVPKLGMNVGANDKFYEMIQRLRKDFSVRPLSFCDEDGSDSTEGSEWNIRSKEEWDTKPSFNPPKGYNHGSTTVKLTPIEPQQ